MSTTGLRGPRLVAVGLALALATVLPRAEQAPAPQAAEALVAAMLGDTPLEEDVEYLSDRIGGRPTGSPANERAVEWALQRFRDAGVDARREAFPMPARWAERSALATITGDDVSFSPRIAAMPFSAPTGSDGASGRLLDGGAGSEADFARLGQAAGGAFVLIETAELTDVDGLFREYTEAAAIEQRAVSARVAGIAYMGSRPGNALYRHNASAASRDTLPSIIMERDAAKRALRLLRGGANLTIAIRLDLDAGGPYESANVVGEIPGRSPDRGIVVMGAHLDSWDLGSGTLDNGANVAMMIDIARQIRRLGLQPERTIRLALWNGEEQGILGSLGYTKTHASELDRHVMAGSVDVGCGRITGFFTGGRPEIVAAVQARLEPVLGLGPFTQIDVPIVGTDNLDFMLEGVANIVANQEPALYGPSYHARTDTLDKCDLQQLRLNAAIVAAVTWGFANGDATWDRQTRADVEALMQRTDLPDQLKTFGLWEDWLSGARGRRP